MNHRERVISALARTGYDRLPVRYQGEPAVSAALKAHFGVADDAALLERLGDDLRYVQPGYAGPAPRHFPDGSRELAWPQRGWPAPARYVDIAYSGGTYTEAVYRPFEELDDPADLIGVDFPSADWLDYSTLPADCEHWADYAIATGTPGVLDFVNGIAHSRGIERTLMDIALEEPVYLALLEEKFAYHYEATERTLQAAGGRIDIVQTGEDLGTQGGLLISPRKFDRLFAGKYRAFFDMVHRHGARAMMHCCGSVRDLLPRLIDAGLDILDVVQVSAERMGIRELQADFGRAISFCGTLCVQTTLPNGTPADVEGEVQLRRELFPAGGLILGPSHLIQPDTPLENILALYRAAGQSGAGVI